MKQTDRTHSTGGDLSPHRKTKRERKSGRGGGVGGGLRNTQGGENGYGWAGGWVGKNEQTKKERSCRRGGVGRAVKQDGHVRRVRVTVRLHPATSSHHCHCQARQ